MSDAPTQMPPGGPGAGGSVAALKPEVDATGLTPPTRRTGPSRFIADVIVALGYVDRQQADAAVEESRRVGKRTGQVLIDWGALSREQLAHALAERFGLDYVDLGVFQADLGAVNLISPQAAKRFDSVPIGFDESGALIVAMADPSNVLALDDLKLMTGHEVRPAVASAEDIAGVISRMSRLDEAVATALEEDEDEDDLAPVTEIRESAEDAPVIKLVNSIIGQAVEEGVSDIHLEPDGRDMRVRFRVDGVLKETTTIPRRMVAGVISRIKIMGDLDIAEKRLPQDGRVGLTVEKRPVDVRIVSMPSVHGEGIVMRLLDKSGALLDLDTLGMEGGARTRFETGFHKAYGAVLVTGPTGSGKSTTLYAALTAVNSVDKNIITIEDPVEYQLAGINQLQVNNKSGLTFARGLRSMLRADPDIIMVGEIRDAETARIAIESALTGHLVLSTLHTNDAPSAVTRLTEMGIEPFLSASALDCIVAQRLVRTLCVHCRRPTTLTRSALEVAGFASHEDVEAYEPQGCSRCGGSGYKGRNGLYEVMGMSEELRSLTVERASADEISRVAIAQGMRPLREDGFERVKQGVTSIAEVARVT
ncbi:MAG TPA: ATPase, T2SS/T4P/T4SS family [Thermoleophilaceae bacterium]|nr:ATPase, T2SS/T4P/T4SS family [Thermoleophilaceae bacterium]